MALAIVSLIYTGYIYLDAHGFHTIFNIIGCLAVIGIILYVNLFSNPRKSD